MNHLRRFFLYALLCLIIIGRGQQATAQTATWDTVALGSGQTIAIKSDSTVWTWGNNSNGQLGIGTTTNQSGPVQVPNFTNCIGVAGGAFHTIALMSDGMVWAWGLNTGGQLGIGTTTNQSNIPVQVPNFTNCISVAAGTGHTIALKSDGTVWTWGSNNSGQLGIGNTTGQSNIPVQVPNFTNCISVACGQNHNVALKSDGTVWTWGLNNSGQLGIGNTTIQSSPVQVPNFTNCMSVACGQLHTIALKSDGTVWTWGSNNNGQSGIGNTNNQSSPVQVPNFTNCTKVAGGAFHTIALRNDGTVWTWGFNNGGQLGIGNTANQSSPVQVTNQANVIKIASGISNYSAIIKNGESNICMAGANAAGQLGDGTTINSTSFNCINDICAAYTGLPTTATSLTRPLPGSGVRLDFQSRCMITASLTPNGASPATDNTNAKVWVEASEPTTNGSICTRRHFEITPAINATTATGRVTLYALQSEFNNYNNSSTTKLPANPTDAAGVSRLRIYKYSGTSSNGTGLPGTYTGTPVTIDPADAAIVWNSTNNYWEISLDITGFSGFFIGADNAVILPVKLTGFTASKQAGTSLLTWKVAQEDNIATYTIERSSDGRSFSTVGSVVSLGNTTAARTYSFPDASPIKGANYYRLKITEKDGKVSYSEMRLLNFGSQISIALFPNPAKDKAVITGVEAGMRIRLLDAVGKVVLVKVANSTTETLAFSSLSGGLYSVQVYNNSGQLLSTARLVKE